MPRLIRRRLVLLGLLACAVLAGPVAVAQASNNALRGTLNSYGPKIVKDENAIKKGLADYSRGKWKPLAHALQREITDIHALESQLAPDPASTAKGKRAKVKIVKGLRMVASAETTVKHYVQLAKGGPVDAAPVNAALAKDKKGNTLLTAGLKLLKHAG